MNKNISQTYQDNIIRNVAYYFTTIHMFNNNKAKYEIVIKILVLPARGEHINDHDP